MRKKCVLHQQLEVKLTRFGLANDEQEELERLSRGHMGEIAFDEVLGDYIQNHNLIHVKDYKFSYDNGKREVQIDNILIANDVIFIFEVKNYQMNLCYQKGGKFSFESGQDCGDLNVQLERQRLGMKELFREMTPKIQVVDYYVFINPEMTIYGLSNQTRVLVNSNVRQILTRELGPNQYSYDNVLRFLENRRLLKSRYDRVFDVDIAAMRKGVFCSSCRSELRRLSYYNYYCDNCSKKYPTVDVIQMMIDELKCLNDEFMVNSVLLSKLSGGQISEQTIRRHHKAGRVKY